MTYTASIQILGFVQVTVEAENEQEARAKIERETYDVEPVTSAIFNCYETEPEVVV